MSNAFEPNLDKIHLNFFLLKFKIEGVFIIIKKILQT